MEDKEKVERLKKEIEELESKKQEKDEVSELLKKRNELKFTKLYGFGRAMKALGSRMSDWAEEKNAELDTDAKVKKKEEKPRDLYEELFGGNQELKLDLGI